MTSNDHWGRDCGLTLYTWVVYIALKSGSSFTLHYVDLINPLLTYICKQSKDYSSTSNYRYYSSIDPRRTLQEVFVHCPGCRLQHFLNTSRCILDGIKSNMVEPRVVIGLNQARGCIGRYCPIRVESFQNNHSLLLLVSTYDSSPDVILVNDFLNTIGITPDLITRTIQWFHHTNTQETIP